MSIEDTVFSTLKSDDDVGPLVSDGGSPAIYQIFKGPPPQGFPTQHPYIVITVVFGRRISTFSGLTGEKNKRIQVDCYADTQNEARTLADHVYDAIGSNMSVGDDPTEQYFFEDDTELHRYQIDFSLWV